MPLKKLHFIPECLIDFVRLAGAILLLLISFNWLQAQDHGSAQRLADHGMHLDFPGDTLFWEACDSIWFDAVTKYGANVADPFIIRGKYLRRKGLELGSEGKWDEAKTLSELAYEDFDKAIRIAPEDFRGYLLRGNIYFDRNENDEAIADYTKVINTIGRINSDNEVAAASAFGNLGTVYARKGMWKKALANLNKAINLNGTDPNTWRSRAITYFEMEDYPKANLDFTKAILFTPNSGELVNARGVCNMRLSKWEESLVDFNRAIDLEPKSGTYYSNRAIAQANLGNKAAALADAQKAQELGQAVDPGFLQSLQQ